MDTISIGDAELAVSRAGQGEPLFLISGLGGRGAFWAKQVSPFAEHFDVITHDHRGTGSSTKSKIDYSVAQMAEDVIRLMDALSIGQTAAVGHSTGGAICQHIALHFPDRLSRMVLSASWPGPIPYFQNLFALRRATLTDIGPDAYLTDGILRAFPPRHLGENPSLLTDTREQRLAAFPGVDIETSRIDAVLGHDLRERLPQIATPTFVIGAEDDQITPVTFFEELADLISGAEKTILPFGGHFVPQVATDAYNAAVLGFLRAGSTGD